MKTNTHTVINQNECCEEFLSYVLTRACAIRIAFYLKCNVVCASVFALSKNHGGDVMHQGQLVLVGNRCHLWGRRGDLGRHLRGVHGWFVPCALLVRPQACELRVRALAHLALVGPLAGVQPDVVAQRGRLTEAAVAEAAHEGLVQRVDAHVGTQVAAGVEAAVANDAAHATRGDGGRGARRCAIGGVRVIWRKKRKGSRLVTNLWRFWSWQKDFKRNYHSYFSFVALHLFRELRGSQGMCCECFRTRLKAPGRVGWSETRGEQKMQLSANDAQDQAGSSNLEATNR